MVAPISVLGVGLLCLLAMSVSAQQPSPGSPDGYQGQGEVAPPRNVTCKNTEGKRPGCTSTCPARCPQQCIVLCPNCKTFCRMYS